MNISLLIQAIKSILQAAYSHRNDPTKWGGWVDVIGASDPPTTINIDGKFTKASVELKGLEFDISVNGAKTTLALRPNAHNLDVFIDGVLDPEARVVVSSKPSAAHPIRLALDVRPVTFHGDETRWNLRFNG